MDSSAHHPYRLKKANLNNGFDELNPVAAMFVLVVHHHQMSGMHLVPAGTRQALDDLSQTDGNGEHVLYSSQNNSTDIATQA